MSGIPETGDVSGLDELLVGILVDPVDHQPLSYFAARGLLYNPRSRRIYEIRGGIPVMLSNEARTAASTEAEALEAELADAVTTGLGDTGGS